ncbi:hypothetical protein ACHAXT_008582 [Thalassiosira profunda]
MAIVRPSLSFRPSLAGRDEGDAIRSRFLFRLGIYEPNFTNASIHDKIRDASRKRQARPDLPQESQGLPAPYLEPLKLDRDSPGGDIPGYLVSNPPSLVSLSDVSSASETDVQAPKPRRPRRVSLDPSVKVVPIPSHRSYSPQVRAKLHASKEELMHNASRNTREFVSEGWDWRTAVEETDMHHCPFSRQLIHPAHLGGIRANLHRARS